MSDRPLIARIEADCPADALRGAADFFDSIGAEIAIRKAGGYFLLHGEQGDEEHPDNYVIVIEGL